MAAEVREWVTFEGGEEAAAAIPDSLTYKVTVVSHIHPEGGEWTSHCLRALQPTAMPLLEGEAK